MLLHFDLRIGDSVSLCVSFSWRISLPSSCFVFPPLHGLFVWPLTSFSPLVSFQSVFVFVIFFPQFRVPQPPHPLTKVTPPNPPSQQWRRDAHMTDVHRLPWVSAAKMQPSQYSFDLGLQLSSTTTSALIQTSDSSCFSDLQDVDQDLQARKVFNWNLFDQESLKTHKPLHSYQE